VTLDKAKILMTFWRGVHNRGWNAKAEVIVDSMTLASRISTGATQAVAGQRAVRDCLDAIRRGNLDA
jgi:hypothetical protein